MAFCLSAAFTSSGDEQLPTTPLLEVKAVQRQAIHLHMGQQPSKLKDL
jgi:hypothetical protein